MTEGRYNTQPRGEANATSKLTREAVRAIRSLYQTGQWTKRQLAKQFGTCNSNIYYIIKKATWTDVA